MEGAGKVPKVSLNPRHQSINLTPLSAGLQVVSLRVAYDFLALIPVAIGPLRQALLSQQCWFRDRLYTLDRNP